MPDVKISELPLASIVNNADIFVLNQGGVTRTASKSLVIAGLATTDQISGLNSAQVQSLTSAQIAAITPASLGAVATSDIIGISKGGTGSTDAVSALSALGGITSTAISGFATTSQIAGIAFTSQLSAFATTAQISGFTNTAQVSAIASAQIAAITPTSIGALSTDSASGFATTSQVVGIAYTSQLSAFATTDQISGFTNSAQVQSLASAQIAAITPGSIGAASTAQLSAYVPKTGTTMEGKLIMAATTAQAFANIGSALSGVAAPASTVGGDVWVSNQSRLTFSPLTGTAVAVAGVSQANIFNQAQTIGVGGTSTSLTVSNNGTGRAAAFTAASTAAAVSILQTGAGEAFRVEDETSPDATAFVVSSTGRVGIGVAPDAVSALSVDSGGIKFADGSIATTALGGAGGLSSAQVQSITSAQIAALGAGREFDITKTYQAGDLVSQNGFIRYSLQNNNTGNTPSSPPDPWWATANAKPTGVPSGDLSGGFGTSLTVIGLQGNPVSATAPSSGNVLTWNGTNWSPAAGGGGGLTSAQVESLTTAQLNAISVSAGTGLTGGGVLSASSTLSIAALSPDPTGTYGSTSQIPSLTVNNLGQVTAVSVLSFQPPNVQTFSTVGTSTYTKPAGARIIRAQIWSAGGGGGSGRKGLAGTVRCGGGGGGSGQVADFWFDANAIGATETVTIGAGGAGAASQTTNSTNGTNGSAGNTTSFGAHVVLLGGAAGSAGTAAQGSGGGGGHGGNTGASASTTGAITNGTPSGTGSTCAANAPGSGAAGGTVTAADVEAAGGSGGRNILLGYLGGAAGVVGGAGGDGVSMPSLPTTGGPVGGSGGGSGGASKTGNAGAGGNGGFPGGGGGGGGGALDNVGNSGAGGNGGSGAAIITTYF